MEARTIFENVLDRLLESGDISKEAHSDLTSLDGRLDIQEIVTGIELLVGEDFQDLKKSLDAQDEKLAALETAIAGLVEDGSITQETADALTTGILEERLATTRETVQSISPGMESPNLDVQDPAPPAPGGQ